MAYKLKVKDKIYDLKDGFTIKEELNETLDSATGIEFETFHEEFIGVPFDHATIYDTENKIEEKHFLIDTYDDEVYSFENTIEENNHHYFVKLFSETKGLERITLPNLTVTQPTTGTKKTVYAEMQKLRQCYIPMLKVYTTLESRPNHYLYSRKYDYSLATMRKFQNFVCPEFQWNNPTLREVLTDLFSVDDCIPVVKKGSISYYSLKETKNPIDTSRLSYSKRTMSSGDFVGELTINMKNAIGSNKTVCCEYVTLQAPEGSATMTTENGVIRTQQPIYNIKKIVVYLCDHAKNVLGNNNGYFHKLDISDRIKEYEDWNILSGVKVSSSKYNDLPSWTDANGLTEKEHKVNYLYYERGKREIHNIGNLHDSSWTALSNFLLRVVGKTLRDIKRTISQVTELGNNSSSLIDPRELFFYVEYETMVEHPMHVGKYLPSPHPENRVFDAQKDSYVDVQHQSIFEYAKVERLGNKIREIYGEYFNESAIPQLGDYIGDEILFSREVTYYDNILLFKGYLTPRYVLKDYYTGVMAKKRSWEIAKGSDALTRHDIYKLYIESSFSEKKDDFQDVIIDPFRYIHRINNSSNSNNVVERFISALGNYNADTNIVHAFVRTRVVGQDFPIDDTTYGIILDLSSEVQGMSIVFNFGFNDNFKAAEYIVKDDNEYVQSFYRYCTQDRGFFDSATIFLLQKTFGLGKSDGQGAYYDLPEFKEDNPDAPYYNGNDNKDIIEENYDNPLMGEHAACFENDGFRLVTFVDKDNREITKWAVQFEYCSDTPDIILTDEFIKFCSLINEKSSSQSRGQLHLALAPVGFKYSLNDKVANAEVAMIGLNMTVPGRTTTWLTLSQPASGNKYSMKASWNESEDTQGLNYGAWAICYWNEDTQDLRILMAVNKNYNAPVYFNMIRSRDTKVYVNTWSQEVAGDISDVEHIEPVE